MFLHHLSQGLLADVPPDLIEVVLLTVYPEATLAELANIFCPECLQSVVAKEDLEDPATLRTKLQLAPAAYASTMPPAVDAYITPPAADASPTPPAAEASKTPPAADASHTPPEANRDLTEEKADLPF